MWRTLTTILLIDVWHTLKKNFIYFKTGKLKISWYTLVKFSWISKSLIVNVKRRVYRIFELISIYINFYKLKSFEIFVWWINGIYRFIVFEYFDKSYCYTAPAQLFRTSRQAFSLVYNTDDKKNNVYPFRKSYLTIFVVLLLYYIIYAKINSCSYAYNGQNDKSNHK